ncbi:MAG TPA: HAMP domain-containing histidine kinase, partial [Candidatus Coproplasma excrementavium]|nr:HAMP domain-containing histidine kinase [Candidatus Coproplasma excrementavium]
MKSEKRGLKRLRSLNLTLWKNFCFLAFFIILFVGIICYLIVQGTISSFTQDKIRKVGVSVSGMLEQTPDDNVQAYLLVDEYIELEAFENNVNIAVLTIDGDIVVPIEQRLSDSEREFWKNVHDGIVDRITDFDGKSLQYVTGNVYTYAELTSFASSPGAPNYLVVRYSVDLANNALNFIQRSMLVLGILVILIALLVAYSMAKKISDPLKGLTATANKMAKGNYDVKFASAEYEEIAHLSDALNYACAEIKKTDGFQKELLANVSHDLKTPLTMIKAYASMIKEISGDNPEKRNQHLQVIIDESDRLA